MLTTPLVSNREACFDIILSQPELSTRTMSVEFILDLNDHGELIGAELLSPAGILGENSLQLLVGCCMNPETCSYAYDREADALYFSFPVSDRRSAQQVAVDGVVVLNLLGQGIRFSSK